MAVDNENPYQFDRPQDTDPNVLGTARAYGLTPQQAQNSYTAQPLNAMFDRSNEASPQSSPYMPPQQQEQQPLLAAHPFHQFLQDRYDAYQKGVGDKVTAPWEMTPSDYRKAVDDYADGPIKRLVTRQVYAGKLPAGHTASEAIQSLTDAYKEQVLNELPGSLESLQQHFASQRQQGAAAPPQDESMLDEAGKGLQKGALKAAQGLAFANAGVDSVPGLRTVLNASNPVSNILSTLTSDNNTTQDQRFATADTLAKKADAIPDAQTTAGKVGQFAGGILPGIASLGSGGVANAQDIIRQGGTVADAEKANAINAAVNAAGLKIGSLGGNSLVRRALTQGAASGGLSEAARVAQNATSDEQHQQPFDPLNLALATGAGAGLGALMRPEVPPSKGKTGETNPTNTGNTPNASANANPPPPAGGPPASSGRNAALQALSLLTEQRQRLKEQQGIQPNTQAEYAFDRETSDLSSQLLKQQQAAQPAQPTAAEPLSPEAAQKIQSPEIVKRMVRATTPQEVQELHDEVVNSFPAEQQPAVSAAFKQELVDSGHDVTPDEVVSPQAKPAPATPANAEDALAAAATGQDAVAPKAAEAAAPATPAEAPRTVESMLAEPQETQRTLSNGKLGKGRVPVDFQSPDDKLAYLLHQNRADPQVRDMLEKELVDRGFPTEDIPKYAEAVSKRVTTASKDSLRNSIKLSATPVKGAGAVIKKSQAPQASAAQNEPQFSRKVDLESLKAPDKVHDEPIFAQDGSHTNEPRTFTNNRIKPRHDTDKVLLNLRAWDRDNPTRSQKMQWLMNKAFPGDSAHEVYDKAKTLYRALSAEARENDTLKPQSKVKVAEAVQRRPVDFLQSGSDTHFDNGIPRDLPATETPGTRALTAATRLHAPEMVGKAPLQAVDRAALPEPIRNAFDAFEKATKTRIEVVRGEDLKFNGAALRNGVLYVNEAANRPLVTVAAHEWTHQMRKDNPQMFAKLMDEVKRQGDLTGYKEKLGGERGDAHEELTADAVGDAMSNPDFLVRLAKSNPTTFKSVAQNFLKYLQTLVGKIKDLGSSKYLKDVQAFHDVLAEQLEGYKGPEGTAKGEDLAFSAKDDKQAEDILSQRYASGKITKQKYIDLLRKMQPSDAAPVRAPVKPYVEPHPNLINPTQIKSVDDGIAQARQDFVANPHEDSLKKSSVELAAKSIARRIVDLRRMSVLSGLGTLGKLGAAVTYRMVGSPLENAVVSGLRAIPLVNNIAKRGSRYSGLNLTAESKSLRDTFSKNTFNQIVSAFKTGRIDIDKYRDMLTALSHGNDKPIEEFGYEGELKRPILDFFARLHAAVKTPAKINEFSRSFEMRSQHEFAQNLANGMPPDKAKSMLEHPAVQARLGMESYVDAQRAILMQDNALHQRLENILRDARDSKSLIAKGAGLAAEVLMPVRKIPINYVAEAAEHAGGLVNSLPGLYKALRHGASTLTRDEADYVLRNLSKQAIGATVAVLAYQGYKALGGYYQGKEDYSGKKPQPGQVGPLPHKLTHAPPLELAHMAATLHYVEDRTKSKEKGAEAAVGGLIKQIPVIDQFARMLEASKNDYAKNKYVDNLIKGLAIPVGVSEAAQFIDEHRNPGVTGRKTTDLKSTLQSGIPGLREQLPAYRDRR